VKIVALFSFLKVMIYLFKNEKIMNVFTSDKLEIEYDSYERKYEMTIYDKYGHYIDVITLDREEIKDLYESLDKIKNEF